MDNFKNLKIAVLYGGNSSERPGSLMSGKTIYNLLKDAGYKNVVLIDLIPENVLSLIQDKPDFAFIALHGPFGEDGSLQGFLEIIGIPYSTSGVSACAISKNKSYFNKFIKSLGFNSSEQTVISKLDELDKYDFTFPKVIKPIAQGCSYGVFCVEDKNDLYEKAAFTMQFDDQIVIEDYIPGRELSIGIYEDYDINQPVVLPIVEFVLKRKIYDYETKYPGGEDLYNVELPAKLPSCVEQKIKDTCAKIFTELDCRGFVRMDARLTDDNELYLLENNIIPGMLNLEESDFPKLLKVGNIDYIDFIDSIVKCSVRNFRKKIVRKQPSEKEMVNYLGLKLAE